MLPPVVGPEFVASRRDEIVVVDLRWYLDGRSGHEAYLGGHLPGAIFVDLAEISAPPSAAEGRHPLPAAAQFAAAMSKAGIAEGDDTVVYDDQGGGIAARLVWMLRQLDCSAAVLDGGIGAWEGRLETDEVRLPPTRFSAREIPAGALVAIDDVPGFAGVVIDARDRSRYLGEGDPIDARSGHIPGARSAPFPDNLDARGRFRSPDELRARFAALGIGTETPVVSYCGSGVTACHNLLALELAGHRGVHLYPGSWSQWAADPGRPIATGDEPRVT